MQSHRLQPTRLPRPWDSPGKNTGVGCHFLLQCMNMNSEMEVAQSCLTLRDPMDCSLPGSSVRGIFQARVLEWDAIAFSDHSANPSQIVFTTEEKHRTSNKTNTWSVDTFKLIDSRALSIRVSQTETNLMFAYEN